jgi:hypothetical protein
MFYGRFIASRPKAVIQRANAVAAIGVAKTIDRLWRSHQFNVSPSADHPQTPLPGDTRHDAKRKAVKSGE